MIVMARDDRSVLGWLAFIVAVGAISLAMFGLRSESVSGASSAAAGIPTVMYGPSGEGAHALEEWVSLSDTVAVARALVDVARRVCA